MNVTSSVNGFSFRQTVLDVILFRHWFVLRRNTTLNPTRFKDDFAFEAEWLSFWQESTSDEEKEQKMEVVVKMVFGCYI